MFSTRGYKSSFDYQYICFCPKNKNQTKNNDLLLNFNWKYNLTLFYMQFYGSNLMCHQNKKPNIKKNPKNLTSIKYGECKPHSVTWCKSE